MEIPTELVEMLTRRGITPEQIRELSDAAQPIDEKKLTAITRSRHASYLVDLIEFFRSLRPKPDLDEGPLYAEIERFFWKRPEPPANRAEVEYDLEDDFDDEDRAGEASAVSSKEQDWQKGLWGDKPWKGGN